MWKERKQGREKCMGGGGGGGIREGWHNTSLKNTRRGVKHVAYIGFS